MIKRVKKFAINTLALVILLSQVTGCAFTSQDETIFETGTTDNSELVESTENEVEQTEEVVDSDELDVEQTEEVVDSDELDIEQTEEVVDISGVYRLSDEEKEIIEDAIEIMGLSGEEAEELEYFATTRAEDGFNVKDTIDEIIMEHEEEQAAQQKPVETKAPAKPKQPSKPKTQNQAPPKQQPKPTQPKETQAPKPTQPKPVETQPAERELTLEERNAIRAEMGMEPHGAYTDMTPEEESAAAEAWSKFK